jgi:hypothetical protein
MSNVYIEHQQITPFNEEGVEFYTFCQIVISDYETKLTIMGTQEIDDGDMTREDAVALCNEGNCWKFLQTYGAELYSKAIRQGGMYLNDKEIKI